jgi:PTS system nitrogen regulatory IIA component
VALGVREAARLLRVSAQTIYRLIHKEELPAHRQGDRYHFDRVELEEWAAQRTASASTPAAASRPSLRGALRHGGIHYDIEAESHYDALRALASLPGDRVAVAPEKLYELLLAREELAPTTVGEGIALPHPRDPGACGIELECVHLCFFREPVDFCALDGQLIHTALMLLSPDVETHLQLLARLSLALRDGEMQRLLLRRASRDEIFDRLDALLRLVELRDRSR